MEFPPKPIAIAPSENVWTKSIFSMLLYLGIYYYLFDQNLINALTVVLVLLVHETGHFLAMKNYGYQDVKMFFIPFLGAYVSGEKEKISQQQQVIVLLAGPIPGIVIGTILNVVAIYGGVPTFKPIGNLFVYINAFNLLPIIPLDGGRLIEALFVKAKDILLSVFILLSVLAVVALAIYTENFFLLIFTVTLLIRLNVLFKTRSIRKDLREKNIDYHKSYSELSNEEYWKIREKVVEKVPSLTKANNPEESILDMIKNVLHDTPAQGYKWSAKLGIALLWFVFLTLIPLLNIFILYIWNKNH